MSKPPFLKNQPRLVDTTVLLENIARMERLAKLFETPTAAQQTLLETPHGYFLRGLEDLQTPTYRPLSISEAEAVSLLLRRKRLLRSSKAGSFCTEQKGDIQLSFQELLLDEDIATRPELRCSTFMAEVPNEEAMLRYLLLAGNHTHHNRLTLQMYEAAGKKPVFLWYVWETGDFIHTARLNADESQAALHLYGRGILEQTGRRHRNQEPWSNWSHINLALKGTSP